VLHLSKVLRRNNARYGVATICIGGGQGGAVLIENVDHVEAE
jgi:acetyl-CoA C-acetyltransferase